ncbi:hypothetical protein HDU96_003461 [Phlyctochytrium bullatum]|nr:hypothetical protein HDU96_003461 [Phlyctochytrium bullatum]
MLSATYLVSLCAVSALLFAPASAQREALAVLAPTINNTVSGTVRFTEFTNSTGAFVKIVANLNGLSPNANHGFHIHAYGDTSGLKGENAYGHFNPFKRNHTCETGTGHAGDLGNVLADASGSAAVEWETTGVTFNRSAPNFVIGRGVIVHEKADDCTTQPTGNAGGRLAQAAIGWLNDMSTGTSAAAAPETTDAPSAEASATSAEPASATETGVTPRSPRRLHRRQSSVKPADAVAVLTPIGSSKAFGSIYFRQNDPDSPLQIAANISGLPPNTVLGARMFTAGDISNPAGPPISRDAVFPFADPCNTTINFKGFGMRSDPSGKVTILPLTDGILYIPGGGLTIFPDSDKSILGRGLAFYSGGFDCDGASSVTSYIAQSVIAVRNGTTLPSFETLTPSLAPSLTAFGAGATNTATASGSLTTTAATSTTKTSGALPAGVVPSRYFIAAMATAVGAFAWLGF